MVDDIPIDRTDYARIIGKLMHLMVYCRPDISFALGKLAQHMANPMERHGQGVKQLLNYVRSTAGLRITYGTESARLIGYSDADQAADKSDRKSHLGNVFTFAGGPISWQSKKQKSVAISTTDAEYMALSECSRQAIWLPRLFKDLGYPQYALAPSDRASIKALDTEQTKLQLKGDNMASIQLVKNNRVSERSKHIDVAYHFIRDLQQQGLIDVSYVPSSEMLADGLTKPLDRIKFAEFIRLLGMHQ